MEHILRILLAPSPRNYIWSSYTNKIRHPSACLRTIIDVPSLLTISGRPLYSSFRSFHVIRGLSVEKGHILHFAPSSSLQYNVVQVRGQKSTENLVSGTVPSGSKFWIHLRATWEQFAGELPGDCRGRPASPYLWFYEQDFAIKLGKVVFWW